MTILSSHYLRIKNYIVPSNFMHLMFNLLLKEVRKLLILILYRFLRKIVFELRNFTFYILYFYGQHGKQISIFKKIVNT